MEICLILEMKWFRHVDIEQIVLYNSTWYIINIKYI